VWEQTEERWEQGIYIPYNIMQYYLTSVRSGTAYMVNMLNYIKFGTLEDKKIYDWLHDALLTLLLDYLSSRNSVTRFVMSEPSLL
jgi:hypothetical protein